MTYDIIIIGGGPAGLTSAIYTARAGKKTLVVENYAIGGQASLTHEVMNYPGIKSISGFELTDNMRKQAESFGAEFVYDNIIKIDLMGGEKEIVTEYSGAYRASKVILAMGSKAKPLGLKGSSAYRQRRFLLRHLRRQFLQRQVGGRGGGRGYRPYRRPLFEGAGQRGVYHTQKERIQRLANPCGEGKKLKRQGNP